MPAFIPGIQPLAALIGEGITLSADQETATVSTDPARTRFYAMGAAVAKVLWAGTASGTIQIRSSEATPPTTDDNAPISAAASELVNVYDQAAGAYPDDSPYTYTRNGSFSNGGGRGVVTADGVRLTGTTGDYRKFPAGIAPVNPGIVGFRFSIIIHTGHTGGAEFYFGIGNRVNFIFYGSAYGAASGTITVGGLTLSQTFALDTKYDIYVKGVTSTTLDGGAVWMRARGSHTADSLTGFALVGVGIATVALSQNILLFGNLGSGGVLDATFGDISMFTAAEWETVTSGQTTFANASKRDKLQARGWVSGTITEIDLQSDLAAPGNPSGPEAGAVGASAIGGNCTTLATGAAAYYAELLDADAADAVLDADWVTTPVHAFRGLAVPGNFKMRFTSASDDGVRGSASVTTASTAVPAVGPTIALTTSGSTVAPGGTITEGHVITGSATVTRNGSPLTGTGSATVATGIAAPYAPPSTPITPLAYRAPTPASPSWSVSVSNLILSEPPAASGDQLAVTTVWLGYRPTPGAVAVKLTTLAGFTSGQVAASSVAVGDVTWTTGTGIVAAFAALVAAVCALFPLALICQGNDDGQVVTWSAGVNPEAQSAYECTVSGQLDASFVGKEVTVRLKALTVAGGQEYPPEGFDPAVVQADGTWSIPGLPRGVVWVFYFPGRAKAIERQGASTATAAYEGLSAPT